MFIWTQFIDQLPFGLLAQLVEHCNGIAEVMGSNPVWAWNFFQVPFTTTCFSSVLSCKDLISSNLLLFRLTLRNLPKQGCVCILKVSPVFRKLVTSLLKQKMKCKQYSFHGNRLNRFQKLWKSTKIARKYGKNKVILIILRLKFLKTRAPCAIGTSLPELQFFSQKNICDKIDLHIARQTWWLDG